MSIGNAMKFIQKVSAESEFRKMLYKVKGLDGLNEFLKVNDLQYSEGEFEEAYNHLHTQCQFVEEADSLFNVVNLIKLVATSQK